MKYYYDFSDSIEVIVRAKFSEGKVGGYLGREKTIHLCYE